MRHDSCNTPHSGTLGEQDYCKRDEDCQTCGKHDRPAAMGVCEDCHGTGRGCPGGEVELQPDPCGELPDAELCPTCHKPVKDGEPCKTCGGHKAIIHYDGSGKPLVDCPDCTKEDTQ